MSRDIKLDIIYIKKEGVQCELEGSFSKETDYKNCMDKIKAEIETLEAFRLFKKKKIPQQLELDMV